jgi:hypothetical protein
MARSCQVEEDAQYSAAIVAMGAACIDAEMDIDTVKKMIG